MEPIINKDSEIFENEINDLKKKYDTLLKKVKTLEDTKDNMNEIVQSSSGVVQGLSKNVENVMNELNNLKNDFQNNTSTNKNNKEKMRFSFSMKKMFVNPLRKVAIGTIQSAFLVVDKTVEGLSNVKEGFEDIVAEAQVENKKKHLQSNDNV